MNASRSRALEVLGKKLRSQRAILPRARSQGSRGNGRAAGKPSASARSSPRSSRDTRYRRRFMSARACGAVSPIAAGTLSTMQAAIATASSSGGGSQAAATRNNRSPSS